MNDSPPQPEVYRYADWELQPQERALLVDGAPVKIGRRAFDVLLALVRRKGGLVRKAELMDAAWPGVIVEENNLSVQIAALRKLIGPAAIANVAGLGYRLAADPALPGALASGAAARPAAPSLQIVGREAELQELAPLLGAVPLLSLVGPGGVGKTTLARAALLGQEARWRDGVHWVDLAPLLPGERLLPLVAKAVGLLPSAHAEGDPDLERAVAWQEALVVLDNCEHLLDELAALLAPLLRRQGAVRWLVTSQEPLHLKGETVFRLRSLDVPPPGSELEQALRHGAMALFVERARAADHAFRVTPAELPIAIDLCSRLDGLPLALEMAAARVATLGIRDVHAQLDERLRLRASVRGGPSRHHTLRQTYEWSHGLLSPQERAVFRRLEPCAEGFTAQLAQAICCSPGAALEPLEVWAMRDALSALVDKSLVQRTSHRGSDARLFLLESARDFARIQLEQAGEIEAARRLHARALALAFDHAQFELERWGDREWTEKYLPERRNVCVALSWACQQEDEPETLARLVAALAQMDALTHTASEVVAYDIPLHQLQAAPAPWRARAHLELGWAHFFDGNRERGTEMVLQALQEFESLGDPVGQFVALMRLIRLYDGRPGMEANARAIWGRLQQIDDRQIPLRWRITKDSTVTLVFDNRNAVARLRALHDSASAMGLDAPAAVCRLKITDELLLAGDAAQAAQTAAEMLDLGEPLPRVRAVMQHNRAQALLQLGRFAEALEAAQAVMGILPTFVHLTMDVAARVAVEQGRFDDAALLSGRSAQLRRERGLQPDASDVSLIEGTCAALEQAMGKPRADAALLRGALMETDEVLLMLSAPARQASGPAASRAGAVPGAGAD